MPDAKKKKVQGTATVKETPIYGDAPKPVVAPPPPPGEDEAPYPSQDPKMLGTSNRSFI